MHFQSDEEIHAIGAGLLDRTLPKLAWTHAAHLAAAAWLLAARPDIDAQAEMPGIIRAYNEATGTANTDTGGYHHTITLASLRAVADFLARQPAETPLHVACEHLLVSPYGNKSWLTQYWTAEVLFSKDARLGWVDPDRAALPF
jgi:hypothetical protein